MPLLVFSRGKITFDSARRRLITSASWAEEKWRHKPGTLLHTLFGWTLGAIVSGIWLRLSESVLISKWMSVPCQGSPGGCVILLPGGNSVTHKQEQKACVTKMWWQGAVLLFFFLSVHSTIERYMYFGAHTCISLPWHAQNNSISSWEWCDSC